MDASARSRDDGVCVAAYGDKQETRLCALEQQMRLQDDEITLLKAALADALRRLAVFDRHFARLMDVLPGGPAFPSTPSADQTVVSSEQPQDFFSTDHQESSCPSTQRRGAVSEARPASPALHPGAQACPGLAQPLSSGPERGEVGAGPRGSPEPQGEGSGVDTRAPVAQHWRPLEVEDPGVAGPGACLGPWGPKAANGPQAPPPASLELGPSPVPEEEPGSQLPDREPSPLTAKKNVLLRRCSTSDRLRGPQNGAGDHQRPGLAKKSVSSLSLLSKGRSTDSRTKEPPQSPVGSSRRGIYNQEGISIKMFLRGRPITMYVPSQLPNHEDMKMELPAEKLRLDWVYGYRGRDCRDNLHLLPSGEIVYFIACVVILYNIEEQTQRHYLKHTDCVRCLATHPDGVRIASGQAAGVDKDGKPLMSGVHIWDSARLHTLQHIGSNSFERGVGCLAFSQADSGTFLCVIDDSNEHLMSVWDCSRGTRQAETKTTNEAVLEVGFNPRDTSCIVSCGKSHVYFWTWSRGSLTKKQGIFGKYKKPKFIQCLAFLLSGEVVTGDSEGNILVWGKAAADTRTLGKGARDTYQISRLVRAHEGSIFTLYVCPDATLLSGGGKDRKIIRWGPDLALRQETEIAEKMGAVRTLVEGPDQGLLVGTTRNAILRGSFNQPLTPIVQGHTDELWGLATHPSLHLFLTCGHDRQVCVWDQRQHVLVWSRVLEGTGLCADFHCSGAVVVVGLQTGRWLVLDSETREDVYSTVDGNEQLSVVRYSPDGNFLAIGSHDNYIYLHAVSEDGHKYSRFGRCTGHSSFITHLDWSQDSRFIMSNSGDYEILYWDVAAGCKLIRNRYECKDLEWVSYTCVLGFHVFGVWPDGSDGTDINALCRSHNERVVAVADDFCKVHLFQYPCSKPKAPSLVYSGHGSHVTNVRFTYNDSHLISTGGKDTTVMQWRVLSSGLERSSSISSASISSLDLPQSTA